MGKKIRTQVNLSEEVVEQIDAVVGTRKRSEFLERAAIAQLRREALDRWIRVGKGFKGLTLEDTYRPAPAIHVLEKFLSAELDLLSVPLIRLRSQMPFGRPSPVAERGWLMFKGPYGRSRRSTSLSGRSHQWIIYGRLMISPAPLTTPPTGRSRYASRFRL